MSQSPSLKLSIVISVGVYFLIQCVVWVFSVSPAVAISQAVKTNVQAIDSSRARAKGCVSFIAELLSSNLRQSPQSLA